MYFVKEKASRRIQTFSKASFVMLPCSNGHLPPVCLMMRTIVSKKTPGYRNYVDAIDEIWFFFDVEEKDIGNWTNRLEIIKRLRKLRKDPKIRVRLLMTTGCIEYWLMLHYRQLAPPLLTVPDKERMLAQVVRIEPTYRKGNYDATARIAQNYPTAVKNATIVLQNLLQEGMPGLEDTDERNRWLCTKCKTFSTVQEAIIFLESL